MRYRLDTRLLRRLVYIFAGGFLLWTIYFFVAVILEPPADPYALWSDHAELVAEIVDAHEDDRFEFTLYMSHLSKIEQDHLRTAEKTDYPREWDRVPRPIVIDPGASISHVYADAASARPSEYYDYPNNYVLWRSLESEFVVGAKLGRGHYCDTFEGHDLKTGYNVVVKKLNPVRIDKIKREISILERVKSIRHVTALIATVRNENGIPCLVFPYEPHDAQLFRDMTVRQARFYFRQLLQALDNIHSRGIMHRDIKPSNLRVDFQKENLVLIDFGLSEFYLPGAKYNSAVATKTYKAPELLLGFRNYDYAVDMWSVGVILAEKIFGSIGHFFKAEDKYEMVVAVGNVLGLQGMRDYVEKYDINITRTTERNMRRIQTRRRVPWRRFFPPDVDLSHGVAGAAVDLIDKLLVYDHATRLTAKEALRHPFFTMEDDLAAPVAAPIAINASSEVKAQWSSGGGVSRLAASYDAAETDVETEYEGGDVSGGGESGGDGVGGVGGGGDVTVPSFVEEVTPAKIARRR